MAIWSKRMRVDVTRSVHVNVSIRSDRGESALGMGEAAALPPVTREDQPDVLAVITQAARSLQAVELALPEGQTGLDLAEIARLLDGVLPGRPVARAGVETAILDAIARLVGKPLRILLGGETGAVSSRMTTDITIPIHTAARMADLARHWRRLGFSHFKVKVGKDLDADIAALDAMAGAVPDAVFRIDANAGFSATDAIRLARAIEQRGLMVECYEQPCAPGDLEGMAEVAAAVAPPVIADESVATLEDWVRVRTSAAADGVNLKLAKSGGPLAALAIGRAARAEGMKVMAGGMVETRLGMAAAANVAAALGGVDFVDLDTAWLLAADPYEGGYVAKGPHLTLSDEPGIGVSETHARN
jgi:L-alanine-DL-glutamate epimerase-like enolase superfamily enzyme